MASLLSAVIAATCLGLDLGVRSGVIPEHWRRRASILWAVPNRDGVVYIAPRAYHVPRGRLVDPALWLFDVSWQRDDFEEGVEVVGAERAITWGRERCDRVLIRLAHRFDSQFSAGDVPLGERLDSQAHAFPLWPPGLPPKGWWTPSDETAAEAAVIESARKRVSDGNVRFGPATIQPNGSWTAYSDG